MTQDTRLAPGEGRGSGPQVIFAMDRDGRCTLSVGPGLAALGLGPGQLVGLDLHEVYRDDPLGLEALRRVLSGESFREEREYLGRRLVLHFEPVHDSDGTLSGAVGVATDVTEQHRAEQRAREASRRERALAGDLSRFKSLVEASPDFVAIAGLDGRVQYVNPGGRALIGMAADVDVTATTIADYLTPEGLVASVEVEQPAVVRDGHWEGETTLRHQPTDTAIPVAVASFLMRDIVTGEPFALATVQRDISDRVAAEAALRQLADQRTALLSRLVDAQDAERAQIAADVHDDPVQAFAAVELRLGLLRRRLRERTPDLVAELDTLQDSVQGATERLRALLFDLEPPDLRHGLGAAIEVAARQVFEHVVIETTVDAAEEPNAPEATRALAYRIVKEALVNVAKHAGARHVAVRVAGEAGGLVVVVEDDGTGAEASAYEAAPGHRGVSGMRDRATLAGGHCTIEPAPAGGTRVTLWLPGTTAA